MQYSSLLLVALAAAFVSAQSESDVSFYKPRRLLESWLTCNQSSSATKTAKGGKSSATDAAADATATGNVSGGSSNSTKSGKADATGGASATAKASASGKASGNSTKASGSASGSSSSSPAKATTAGAPSLLAQGGGMVTIAGLGVAFAVFM